MGKVKTIFISSKHFSILHEMIMEKCYGEKAIKASGWSDVELYGYNKSEKFKRKNSLSSKIFPDVNGRTLQKTVQDYRQNRSQKISEVILIACLNFLGFMDLEQMEKVYCKEKGIEEYIVPKYLKYSKRSIIPQDDNSERSSLQRLVNTNWYSYSLFRNRSEKKGKNLHRLSLIIGTRLTNGDYLIELKSIKPYTSFSGRIVKRFSTANVLTCELTSIDKVPGKRLYLFIHIGSDSTRDLYLGCFLRHTDVGMIYSGSFVMEKVENQKFSEEPIVISFEEALKNKVNKFILNFLYSKKLNSLIVPTGIYASEDLQGLLEDHTGFNFRGMPEYDLFVSTPIKGFIQQEKRYNSLKMDLLNTIRNKFISDKESENKSLEKDISEILDKHLYAIPKDDFQNFEEVRNKILHMIQRLKQDDIGYKKIWYSAGNSEYLAKNKTDSSVLLLRQLSMFNLSKRFLFILPSYMVSSAFLELSWAMISERNIPTFIVANRQDLPFLLKKADTLSNRNIHIGSWEEVGGIEGIPEWILHSGWHK